MKSEAYIMVQNASLNPIFSHKTDVFLKLSVDNSKSSKGTQMKPVPAPSEVLQIPYRPHEHHTFIAQLYRKLSFFKTQDLNFFKFDLRE